MNILILTVGTGTAGKYSDLAQGLINTIGKMGPRCYWLVPSSHPDSVGLAQLVRESDRCRAEFQPWSPTDPFRCIAAPDDIFDCRATLREVLLAAKSQLRLGEQLLVNPTSGTKQMSAGATLAALDEEIGEIVFTVGERADGVVKTGTERLAPFSTAAFFWERDLRTAGELFQSGAFAAAARLLRDYPLAEALRPREIARCLHEWQRMNYSKAVTHAAKFSEPLRRHLKSLAEAPPSSEAVLGDLLAGADELLRWGDGEEALARYYRGAEQSAKVRLANEHGLAAPYQIDAIRAVLPPGKLLNELQNRARNGQIQLTAEKAWDVLEECQDPMATSYRDNGILRAGLSRRNESFYGHGQLPVDPAQVQEVRERLRRLLEPHLAEALAAWTTAHRPKSLV